MSLPEGKSFRQICTETGLSGPEAIAAWSDEAVLHRKRIAELAGYTGATALEELHNTGPIRVISDIAKHQAEIAAQA